MAKLTLSFKDKAIRSYRLEPGVPLHVGRTETNEIQIDSLAVAPTHAVIAFDENGAAFIKQLDDAFPLTVNEQGGHHHRLLHGNRIGIGKHILEFADTTSTHDSSEEKDTPPAAAGGSNDDIYESSMAPEANLQILNGRHIGRLIPLKRALTRLGKNGSGVVVIARRKSGYFLSPLESNQQTRVNNEPLGEKTIHLSDGDTLELDSTAMQFFVEPLSNAAPHDQDEQPA